MSVGRVLLERVASLLDLLRIADASSDPDARRHALAYGAVLDVLYAQGTYANVLSQSCDRLCQAKFRTPPISISHACVAACEEKLFQSHGRDAQAGDPLEMAGVGGSYAPADGYCCRGDDPIM